MEMKLVFVFFLILVIFISGCISDECKELEKELTKRNITCRCIGSKLIPEELANRTDVTPKCFCKCKVGEEWETIQIVETIE